MRLILLFCQSGWTDWLHDIAEVQLFHLLAHGLCSFFTKCFQPLFGVVLRQGDMFKLFVLGKVVVGGTQCSAAVESRLGGGCTTWVATCSLFIRPCLCAV